MQQDHIEAQFMSGHVFASASAFASAASPRHSLIDSEACTLGPRCDTVLRCLALTKPLSNSGILLVFRIVASDNYNSTTVTIPIRTVL